MTLPWRPGRAHVTDRALVAVFLAAGGILAACGAAGAPGDSAQPRPTARSTPSPAVAATLVQVDDALRVRGLVLQSTLTAVRPAEPPSFAGVARWPFQAVLPNDPAGGYFVIYEFADLAFAEDAGRDLAAYVTSGPGRVEFPPDVRFVLRQVGSTLVFYPWSPASSPDSTTPGVAAALASVGSEVPIPRG
jgi:hypothetical protein